MSQPRSKSRWRKLGKMCLFATLAFALLLALGIWYVTTDSFRAIVQRRLVAELEEVTGGRAEIGSFKLQPLRFRVELTDLTIHGKEPAGEAPFIHVGHLVARVKIISVLEARFGFHSVIIDHPSVHFIVYPDGTTNQPGLAQKTSQGDPMENLFALSINRLEVRHGVVLLNEQKIPLDFSVNDLSADMQRLLLRQRYQGNVLFSRVETRFDGYRPVAWSAEAHFELASNEIALKSLKITSHGAHLEASGTLNDFHHPSIQATGNLDADLAEVAAVTRRSDLRRGTLRVSGTGKWSEQTFSSSGKLSLEGLGWRDQQLDVRSAGLNTQFSLSPERLTLSQIQARVLGGTVTGDVDVYNWSSPQPTRSLRKPLPVQQGSARFRATGVSVKEAIAALPSLAGPLERLRLAGSADGTVQTRWRGSWRLAETQVAVDISPPAQPSADQFPLTARMRLTYNAERDELKVDELTANTRTSQLSASGLLSANSELNVSVTTTDLGEWQPLLRAFNGPENMPATLHGRATLTGVASGHVSSPAFTGTLHAENFESLVPATSRTPRREVHWDSLEAHLQASSHSLTVRHGKLQHGPTELDFDASLGLVHGRYTPQSPVSLRLDVRKADLAELQSLAGYNYPVAGTLDLHAEIEGTSAAPEGEGHFLISDATLYGQAVQHFSAGAHFADGEARLENIDITHDDARVTGTAAYTFSSRAAQFDLHGKNFDLAAIPQIQSHRLTVAGRMDFTAAGSGTLDEPTLNATVDLRDLVLNDRRVGNFSLTAVTEGSTLHVSGQSQFEQAQLKLAGNVQLRGDWPCDIKVHLSQWNTTSLLRAYVKIGTNTSGVVSGDLEVQGPLRRPRELRVTGSLDDFQLGVEDFKLRNQGPIQFAFSGQVLKVEPFHLIGERTDISGSGTIQLIGEHHIEASVHGRINLRLIQTFNRDFTSGGVLTVDLSVGGTVSHVAAQGQLQIQNGSIAYIDLPSALSEINGSLVFNQDRVQIEKLTARTGGGLLDLQGFAAARNGQLSFDLTAHGEDVRLRYPPGVSATASLDVRFTGTSAASTLSGNITVTRLAMTPGFDFATYFAASTKSPTLSVTNPVLNRIRLDVHVTTTPELQMQTAAVRLTGDADLRLRGTAGKPALLGRVDASEGEIYFNGAKYTLERGEVSFLSPVGIKPTIDVQMSTRVRDYDINVSANGDPSKGLKVNYRSEPPLPEADIITLLALGRTREETAQLQQSSSSPLGTEASNLLLTEALNATVSNRVSRLFGGSRIKIDPQGLNTETSTTHGPQVTIEQQVTNKITLTYSTNVSQTSQQIIQLEYNVSRNLSIVALRDQNGVVSFDVRIRRRRK